MRRVVSPLALSGILLFSGIAGVVQAGVEPTLAGADENVYACGAEPGGAPIIRGYETFGISASALCGAGGDSLELLQDGVNLVAPSGTSGFVANAPPGLLIAGASIPIMSLSNTVGTGYVAYFVWTGGQQRVDDAWGTYNIGLSPPRMGVGITLGCAGPSYCPPDKAHFYASNLMLDVVETAPPTVIALGMNDLWYQAESRWVRGGAWSVAYTASAPSGIASMSAAENGAAITSPLAPTCVPNGTVWQQCPSPQSWSPTVSLTGNGAQQLTLSATSAAGNTSPYTETIHVDNTQPTVALSGPTQASPTSGTQYVTAAASVGPSGLGSITCSVDGAPERSFSSSPASVPVSGLGMHTVRCTATNRSYDPQGQPASSAPASWQLDVADPTVSAISFAKIVHGLRCKHIEQRVRSRARWVWAHRRGKLVRVRRRGRTKLVKVLKCHVRVVRRRVITFVKVKRHGRTVLVKRRRVENVALPPRVVAKASKRVRYGHGARVSGFLASSSGVALAGRTIEVLTQPDNGVGRWTQATSATTAADGGWSAWLPRGPSRLVEALYGGDATTQSSTSAQVHLIVPARVKLVSVTPRRVPWGGTVHVTGRLLGGYLPPGGALVRLRIGSGSSSTTYGVKEHVTGRGRFSTTYTFGAGQASSYQSFWFEASSLPMGSYPFAPSSSGRKSVLVGGSPRCCCCRPA